MIKHQAVFTLVVATLFGMTALASMPVQATSTSACSEAVALAQARIDAMEEPTALDLLTIAQETASVPCGFDLAEAITHTRMDTWPETPLYAHSASSSEPSTAATICGSSPAGGRTRFTLAIDTSTMGDNPAVDDRMGLQDAAFGFITRSLTANGVEAQGPLLSLSVSGKESSGVGWGSIGPAAFPLTSARASVACGTSTANACYGSHCVEIGTEIPCRGNAEGRLDLFTARAQFVWRSYMTSVFPCKLPLEEIEWAVDLLPTPPNMDMPGDNG